VVHSINGAYDPNTFNVHGLAAAAIDYNVTADQDYSFGFGKFASSHRFSGVFV
jgi:hypothetical protein